MLIHLIFSRLILFIVLETLLIYINFVFILQIIRLNFTSFALENNCNNDNVEIYDGSNLLDRICGTGQPPEYFTTGDNTEMRVMFRSNGAIENTGFRAVWSIGKETALF